MRKIFCDCCNREIKSTEALYSMEITKGLNKELSIFDMCRDCYNRIKQVVDNAMMSEDK